MAQPRVSVAERLAHLRALLRRGSFNFDEAIKDADRTTICVTLFALLELYKHGEAAWEQEEPFGEIVVARLEARDDASSRPAGSNSRRSLGRSGAVAA